MKNKLLYILTVTALQIQAQSQVNWAWAKSTYGPSSVYHIKTGNGQAGTTLLTGYFSSPSITIGNFTLTNTTNAPKGFVAKHDAAGNITWANATSTSGFALSEGICSDKYGNFYIAGTFWSSMASPSFTLNNPDTTNSTTDAFLVKYNSSGTVLWAKRFGSLGSDAVSGVQVDGTGNVFVSGSFGSGNFIFGTTTITSTNNSDIFLTKFDASGNPLWAVAAGGPGIVETHDLCCDTSGNVFMGGCYSGPSAVFGTSTITNVGVASIYLVKYNNNGSLLWVKGEGGTKETHLEKITVDKLGNPLIAGYFHDSLLVIGTTTLSNSDQSCSTRDIFIISYNSSTGSPSWGQSAGGLGDDYATGFVHDDNGNIYLSGTSESSILAIGGSSYTNNSANLLYVSRLNSAGVFNWTGIAEGDLFYESRVTCDNYGNAYVTVVYSGSATVATFSLNTSLGSFQILMAKVGFGNVGINEIDDNSNLFPNPFTETLTLESATEGEVEISDLEGRVVYKAKINEGQNQLNTAPLNKGIYTLKLSSKVSNWRGKLVKAE